MFSTRLEKLPPFFTKFEIVVCKLFQFGPVQNFVVWERVKHQAINQSFD